MEPKFLLWEYTQQQECWVNWYIHLRSVIQVTKLVYRFVSIQNVPLYSVDHTVFFFTQPLPTLPNLVPRQTTTTTKNHPKIPSVIFQFSLLSLYNEIKTSFHFLLAHY